AQPTVRSQWRLSQPELLELHTQLDFLLAKKFIRPSTSPYTAPILFHLQKGWRTLDVYRLSHAQQLHHQVPLPDSASRRSHRPTSRGYVFSKIDLQGGYHQIRVAEADIPKTVFPTHYRSYEYTVMQFGLTNAPSTFQLTMNEVFRSLLDKCVFVFQDDILVYSTSREQHLKDLEAVFTLYDQHGLITNGSKCEFLKEELEFLGHVISTRGVRIDPKKSTLFATFYEWGARQQATFDQQKTFLITPPVLRIADLECPYELVTDASNVAVGAVLLQDFGEGLQPISNDSRKIQGTGRNHPIHDKEMLAIVNAFKTWRCYLSGADVTVRSDHKSLQFIRAQPTLNPRQFRWLEHLESNFHNRITYNKGANNIADALSRPSAHTSAVLIAQNSPLLTGLNA
ncbi:hypothetical protein CLOM_g20766, partial [Closterium sp. NIES-68]